LTIRKPWLLVLVLPAFLALALPLAAEQQSGIFDRLDLARLAPKHADVVKYAAARKTLPPPLGLQDIRAVIHCHGYLSHDSWGHIEDLLAAAKASGTRVVMMTDHPGTKYDWFAQGFAGMHDGVLFIPGAETGDPTFLLFPRQPIGDTHKPPQTLSDAVHATGGIAFIGHPETWKSADWGTTGLVGMELYNQHYNRVRTQEMRDLEDAMTEHPVATDDATKKMVALIRAFRAYPQETFAFVQQPLPEYAAMYDRETAKHRFTAIAGNDCHAYWGVILEAGPNGSLISKGVMGNPMAALDPARLEGLVPTTGKPGEKVFEFFLDPYPISFKFVGTHILAPKLEHDAIFDALRAGHAYLSFDWIADATGFSFLAQQGRRAFLMGDEVPLQSGLTLTAALPLPSQLRLIKDGQPIALAGSAERDTFKYEVKEKGVYRLEAWLKVGDESFPWIYSNPVYVR